jgi:hypothetical protein
VGGWLSPGQCVGPERNVNCANKGSVPGGAWAQANVNCANKGVVRGGAWAQANDNCANKGLVPGGAADFLAVFGASEELWGLWTP